MENGSYDWETLGQTSAVHCRSTYIEKESPFEATRTNF